MNKIKKTKAVSSLFFLFLVFPFFVMAQVEVLGPIDQNSQKSDHHKNNDDDSVNLAKSKYTPTNLTASAIGEHAIKLVWRDHAKKEDGYEIQRRSHSQGWHTIDHTGKNVETYIDRTVISGTTYFYRVAAFDSERQTAWSNEATATTPGLSPEQKLKKQKAAELAAQKQKLEQEYETLLKKKVAEETKKTKEELHAIESRGCTLANVPPQEVDRAFRERCEQLTGQKISLDPLSQKPSLWHTIITNTKARLLLTFFVLFIIINNVIWHIMHRTVKNRLRGEF